jgi:hypothetical protein
MVNSKLGFIVDRKAKVKTFHLRNVYLAYRFFKANKTLVIDTKLKVKEKKEKKPKTPLFSDFFKMMLQAFTVYMSTKARRKSYSLDKYFFEQ